MLNSTINKYIIIVGAALLLLYPLYLMKKDYKWEIDSPGVIISPSGYMKYSVAADSLMRRKDLRWRSCRYPKVDGKPFTGYPVEGKFLACFDEVSSTKGFNEAVQQAYKD